MEECLVTRLKAKVNAYGNFKVFGYASSFEADSVKNAIFGIDHARVKVFGTSEPCINNDTQEVLGTDFSVQDTTVVKFPCGDGVKVFLDLKNTNQVIGDRYSTKYFKNFHLEKVHKVTKFYISMRERSLNINNVFDGTLELEAILNSEIVTDIELTSEKVGAVDVKININNFKALRKIKIGDRVKGKMLLNLNSIPESLVHIEFISSNFPIEATGSINSITKTNMERIQVIGATNVTGSLEKVVEGMWAKGRRSGACVIIIKRTSATFNGSVPDFDTTAKFDNSGVTIYKKDTPSGDIVATYNGTTWSYS